MSYQIVKDLCETKLKELKLNHDQEYVTRLNKEVAIIHAQDMSQYLLDCADAAKNKGKVKNTNHFLVTYLLGISIEDPIKEKLELIKTKYEEFPDIDSDFEDTKREQVKQYLIDKYGSDNVSNIIAFTKNKAKNTIKDVSRIKGVSYDTVNEITKHLKGGAKPDTIQEGYDKYRPVQQFFDNYSHVKLLETCLKIEGNVRQPTKHAAGIVVSPVPLTDIVGLMKAKGHVISCWEEGIETRELSKVGLIKIDVLGLGTLTVLSETSKYVKALRGVDINWENLDLNDVNVLKGFYDANTVGIFQFEKEELRNLLKKIKISSFSDISAVNALNRPGPLGTNMDEKFWKVKSGLEKPNYLHPKLEPILKDTYGVMLYQEQLIRIVQDLAGLDTDEADNFRKVLTKESQAGRGKGINPLEKYEKQFVEGCLERGVTGRINVTRDIYDVIETPSTAKDIKEVRDMIDKDGSAYKIISCNIEIADEIFHQIKSFAEYGFNKCLTGDVRVKFSDYSSTKISTLFENKDKLKNLMPVFSFDSDGGKIITNKIHDIVESGKQDVYLLTTKSRKHISCTTNHKVRTNNGWKELGNIGVNDKVLTMKGAELFWDDIITIKYQGKKMTYDVSLEDQTHPYFFANNIGVHNSHSTAYAYLAYQCMYLKTYYPKEYMSMLLSYTPNSSSNADNINYFVSYLEEARRMGINILPPDVNKSMKEFKIEENSIRSGLTFLKGMGDAAIEEIIKKRPFQNITELLMKVNATAVNKTAFYDLVYSGAFDQFMPEKDITERYRFINEYNRIQKIKARETKPTLLQAVEKETEVCGAEIFNTSLKAIDLKKINERFEADEKICSFRDIDKLEVNSTIRVIGKVERFFAKKVGFVDVKSGLHKKTFMLWKDDLVFLERNEDIKNMILGNAIITFVVKRSKDYNGKRTFCMVSNSIQSVN